MKHAISAAAALAALIGVSLFAPQWLVFMVMLVLAKGVVVLGLLVLMRTGLVSFGQGLYFGIGAYAAALLSHHWHVSDAAVMLLAGSVAAALVAALLGLLLARYREIFFAMLSLAFSMILYGLLVKSAALGSTDGFNLHARAFLGIAIAPGSERRVFLAAGAVCVLVAALLTHRLIDGHWGQLATAVRDNELRVSYLGASPYRVVYFNYLIAGALAGLGGALAALAVGHVDPKPHIGPPRASSCSLPFLAAHKALPHLSWLPPSSRCCARSPASTRPICGRCRSGWECSSLSCSFRLACGR